ncbi:MAG: pyridoxal phosphate-dependent aminotransferase [Alphaproteobacteria bacterium]
MTQSPYFTPLMNSLPSTVPFVGPEALERLYGQPFQARIGANESVFGPSPRAIEAMRKEATEVFNYADPENYELQTKLALFHGIAFDQVMVGEGIDGLFGILARLTCSPDTKVVTSLGAYPTFIFQVANTGASVIRVPYKQDHEDLQGLLDAVKQNNARLCYLANPDNPMGTWHKSSAILDMLQNLPETCLLILDEAYCEFAPEEAKIAEDFCHPQLLRFRTFSKAHGMAGLRVGYVFGYENLTMAFNKVRNHFGLNRMAQIAAMASLSDHEHQRYVRNNVEHSKQVIAQIALEQNCQALPSATNFVAIDLGEDGALSRTMVEALGRRGIFVRMPGVAPLDRCIRVTAGRQGDMDILREHFGPALAEAKMSTKGQTT